MRRNAEYLSRINVEMRRQIEDLNRGTKTGVTEGNMRGGQPEKNDGVEEAFRELVKKQDFDTRKKGTQERTTYATVTKVGHDVVIESREGGPAAGKVEGVIRNAIVPQKARIKVMNIRTMKEGKV